MLAGEPELEVVGEAVDGAEVLALVDTLRPDVILGPAHGRRSRDPSAAEQGSAARVLVLTTYDSDRDVVPALEAGATGYLLKDAPRAELVRAIRAARGEAVLARSPGWSTSCASPKGSERARAGGPVAQGETNRGAAARLFISRRRSRRISSTSTRSSRSRTALQRSALVADRDGRGAVVDVELRVDVEQVRLDRRLGDEQAGRGAAVRLALGDQRQDLELAVAQRLLLGLAQLADEPRRDGRREDSPRAAARIARTSSSRGASLSR